MDILAAHIHYTYSLIIHRESLVFPAISSALIVLAKKDTGGLPVVKSNHVMFPWQKNQSKLLANVIAIQVKPLPVSNVIPEIHPIINLAL